MTTTPQKHPSICKAPRITIGMPVYNCKSTVAEAIASILNQTFEDWQLIVYDDGSHDNTLAVARQFNDPRVVVVEGGKNHGLPACLNRIISHCDTEYFARMDGDDIAYPRRLEVQLAALEKDSKVDLLGSSISIVNAEGVAVGLRHARETHEAICGRPWSIVLLPHVTWMGRTEWFRSHPYDESATHAQDRDLLLRHMHSARYAAVPSVLVGVREIITRHKQNLARRQMIKSFSTQGMQQRNPALLFVSTGAELLKWGADAVATCTGLNHRLLKYRVPPIDDESIREWQLVLKRTRATVSRFVEPTPSNP